MIYSSIADLHLRPDSPRCRNDQDWKARMVSMLQILNKAPGTKVFAGDLFNASEMPAWVVNMFLDLIDEGVIYAGNHDFKYKNLLMIAESRIGHILKNTKYQAFIPETDDGFCSIGEGVLVCHRLVYPVSQKGLADMTSGITANDLIDEALEFDSNVKWVFIGDNHHRFTHRKKGVTVVNPGSPLRYSADMKDAQCGYYVIDTEKDTVTFQEIEDDADLVSDRYLEVKKQQTEVLKKLSTTIVNTDDKKTLDYFERCDKGIKEHSKGMQDSYEDIKSQTMQINYGKGV